MNGSNPQTSIDPALLISYGAAGIGAVVLLAVVGSWVVRGKAENPKAMLCLSGIAFLLMTFTFWRSIYIKYSESGGFEANFEQFEARIATIKEGALDEINAEIGELEEATEQANISTAALRVDSQTHADRIVDLNQASAKAKTARDELSNAVGRSVTEQAALKDQNTVLATTIGELVRKSDAAAAELEAEKAAVDMANEEARRLIAEIRKETEKQFQDVHRAIAEAVKKFEQAQALGRSLTDAEKDEVAFAIEAAEGEDTSDALLLGAWIFYADEKYEDAVTLASLAIDKNESGSKAYYARATAFLSNGQSAKALPDYDTAIELDAKNADAYNNRGIAHSRVGEWRNALNDYGKAIGLDPDNPSAYLNRGVIYAERKKHTKALDDYDKAIELGPADAGAYNNRAITYGEERMWAKALADFETAVELDPEDADTYFNRALLYGLQRENSKALADYHKVIALDPNYVLAYRNRALLYENLNEPAKAAADRKKYEELSQSSTE